jgi:DNA/RNA endonuclease G (NUC1)
VPNLVGVPTHFFKVVLAESKSRNMFGAKPVGGADVQTPGYSNTYVVPDLGDARAHSTLIQCDVSLQTVVGAFVMPNAPIDPDMPLTSFTVPLEALESASGLRFFPVRRHRICSNMHIDAS